jgi:deoxyribodipyrimidine photolyase-related protein
MKHAVFIFPTQLFENHPQITAESIIFLIEHPRYFTDFAFHKQKLILHRASMKAYQQELIKCGRQMHYIEFNNVASIHQILKKKNVKTIAYLDPADHELSKDLKKQFSPYTHSIEQGPGFISDQQWLKKTLGNKKHCTMNSFYIAQRKRLAILVKDNKPVGGKWSYDTENRQKPPQALKPPIIKPAAQNKHIKLAIEYVELHFGKNPGESSGFIYPIQSIDAQKWFKSFLEHRLELFGAYQDAIIAENNFMFHSVLSPLLNTGLLTPEYVAKETLAFAEKHKTPINSVEGFLRQIIGWREFVYGIYLLYGQTQRKKNYFNHHKKLPPSFWNGTTGIEPLDQTIKKILKTAYAHHIERLMVLGNYMLITETSPDDIYIWFMELFIDSYDWVMVPNVYGMSQYADGGFMTSKPYFSSSKYILSMSNYKKGSWSTIWDALFWNFIIKNKTIFSKNARLARTVGLLGSVNQI